MHGATAGEMATDAMLTTEAAVTGGIHESLDFFVVRAKLPMRVLRLYLGFGASTTSEPVVKPQGLCLTERVQWAFERLGGCGVRPSIWQHPHGEWRRE